MLPFKESTCLGKVPILDPGTQRLPQPGTDLTMTSLAFIPKPQPQCQLDSPGLYHPTHPSPRGHHVYSKSTPLFLTSENALHLQGWRSLGLDYFINIILNVISTFGTFQPVWASVVYWIHSSEIIVPSPHGE